VLWHLDVVDMVHALVRVDRVDSTDMIAAAADLQASDPFPQTTTSQWRAAVDKVLGRGGQDLTSQQLAERFERDLVTHTVDGLVIQPLYTDLGNAPEPGVPGGAPFTRGGTALAHRSYGWDVRQRVLATADADHVARLVLDELERGATSILLDVSNVEVVDVDYLDAALREVFLDLAPIVIWNANDQCGAATALLELFERRGVTAHHSVTSLGLDPIGRFATAAVRSIDDDLTAASAVAGRCAANFADVRSIVVDATVVHEAGGGDVEELAYAVSSGLEYVRALTGAGLSVDAAFEQLEFRLAATPDQFMTIAKFRAARRLWQRVASVSGASTSAQIQHQHAVSSTAAASRYDVWVNLLRGTVECFGAGIGGADAVTILPHDEVLIAGGSELGRRMARNTQLVLIEESNLAKVIDIAGGSWYVEQLTDQLANAAWSLMQELERAGGLVAAVRSGIFQERVAATRTRRDAAVATRRQPMTGLTEFPNIAEEVAAATATAVAADATLAFAPLQRHRYADPVEYQRQRADAMASSPAGRPTIFLAAVGSTSTNAARVSFAKNLFEVGGIAAVIGDGSTDPAEIRSAFEHSGAKLVCICASDPVYAEHAAAVAAELKATGPARLYLAGKPRGMDQELADAGVDEQIAAGDDVVAVVRTALDAIGASS
jgi:methylmalonyl-CoA mutase